MGQVYDSLNPLAIAAFVEVTKPIVGAICDRPRKGCEFADSADKIKTFPARATTGRPYIHIVSLLQRLTSLAVGAATCCLENVAILPEL